MRNIIYVDDSVFYVKRGSIRVYSNFILILFTLWTGFMSWYIVHYISEYYL